MITYALWVSFRQGLFSQFSVLSLVRDNSSVSGNANNARTNWTWMMIKPTSVYRWPNKLWYYIDCIESIAVTFLSISSLMVMSY